MIKSIASLFCAMFISMALFAGGAPANGNFNRPDKLDSTSQFAKQKLQRAQRLLATLIPDPESYHLILSSATAFGGEAVPPGIFSNKPTMILYQGALSPNRSDEEIAFMMAHELGHLNLHHMEMMDAQMDKIFSGHPIGISGTTFFIFKQKLQEREADMFGLSLYKRAGYDLSFFPHTLRLLHINPNIHFGSSRVFVHELPSLSMKDSHFSMKERFALLVDKATLT